MDENGMKFDEGEVDELTRALFHDATVVTSTSNVSSSSNASQAANSAQVSADPSATSASNPQEGSAPSGGITFDALKAQLTKHDGLLQNLSISIDRWLVPPKPKKPATLMESFISKVSFVPLCLGQFVNLIKLGGVS